MNKTIIILAWAGILVVSLSTLSFAEVPNKIAFQGMLTDASDTPLTGSYQAAFSIYDAPKGGSPLWQETQTITAKDGLFNVYLGEVTAITLTFDKPYYIDVSVAGELLINRQPLLSVPYALSAKRIEGLTFKDGNAGIGTTQPGALLEVAGDNGNASFEQIRLSNTHSPAVGETNGTNDINSYFMSTLGNTLRLATRIRTYKEGGWTAGDGWASHDAGLSFWTIDQIADSTATVSEKMRITPSGNVGIGTTEPGALLEISRSSSDSTIGNLHLRNTTATGIPSIRFYDATSNPANPWAVYNRDGSYFAIGVAGINEPFRATRDGNVIMGVTSGGTSSGNVGIGTTSPGATLEIKAGGTTLADAWTPRSSRRWKENIKPIEGALDKVKSLRGVYFDWKASGKHDMGLIAEEVGEVIPEVVAYEDNAKDAKSLDYDRLVAVLIEAVKDQQQQLDELKAELQSLKQSH